MRTSEADFEACRVAIREGSKSFHAASLLLPERVRRPALALYAFCRLADDAVDLDYRKEAAVLRLRERLAAAYAGRPEDAPQDRAFAQMIRDVDMPRALPEALLEGFAWDAVGRRYETISDVRAYSARVASTVGVMMSVLMGVRSSNALSRACDLGVAMQLTNIARDVGEDAREGRLYLPMEWMREAGLDPDTFLARPTHSPQLSQVIRRLLREAHDLYARSGAGIKALPRDCRPAIFAARSIYAAIGARIAANGYDSVSQRAYTSKTRKVILLGKSMAQSVSPIPPASYRLAAPSLLETSFLVEAAAANDFGYRGLLDLDRKVNSIIDVLVTLKSQTDMRPGLAETVLD